MTTHEPLLFARNWIVSGDRQFAVVLQPPTTTLAELDDALRLLLPVGVADNIKFATAYATVNDPPSTVLFVLLDCHAAQDEHAFIERFEQALRAHGVLPLDYVVDHGRIADLGLDVLTQWNDETSS